MNANYLTSVTKLFEYYKMLGDRTFSQIPDDRLFWQYNEFSNSIATIIKHLWGNMLSRWSDFLTTDGEKEWRNRDVEFVNDTETRNELMNRWNEGWKVLFDVLKDLKEDDLAKIIYIRNQGHTVLEAINRQLAHYSYHIGQIVFIGKLCAVDWVSLSIPKENSNQFNTDKFSNSKQMTHFTDEYLDDSNNKNRIS